MTTINILPFCFASLTKIIVRSFLFQGHDMVVNNIIVIVTYVVIYYCDIVPPFTLDLMNVGGTAIE